MRTPQLLMAGVIAATFAGTVQAQVKFAEFNQSSKAGAAARDIKFQEAKDMADLKHGTLVSLKLKDDTKVTGHVVRFDEKNNKLYLRTRPGEAPVAFAENDLKKIDTATRPVDRREGIVSVGIGEDSWRDIGGGLEENDNGVVRIRPRGGRGAIKPAALNRQEGGNRIRPASPDDAPAATQTVVEPEIIKQVSYNGTRRSVVYYSTVVSPGEREILEQLQKAENDLMALVNQQDQRDIAIAQESSLQEQRLLTQRLINITMQNENNVNYPYPVTTTDMAGIPSLRREKGVITALPQVIPPVAVAVDRIPPVDPQAVSKVREDLMRLMRNNAAFEDGRLVAVIAKQ